MASQVAEGDSVMEGISSSGPGGLETGNLEVEHIDIHSGVKVSQKESAGRRRSLDKSADEDIGWNKKVKSGKSDTAVIEKSHRPVDEVNDVSNMNIAMTGTKPLLVKFLDQGKRFTNPAELSKILNKSPLQKYIVQYSIRGLGNGSACRLEIRDPNGKMPPVEEIKKIEDLNVRL